MEALGAGHVDLDADPIQFLATFDAFVVGQDYDDMDEEEWVWLITMLGAYTAQVLIAEFGAVWDLVDGSVGENFVLRVEGRDGFSRLVSPLELVYEDATKSMPPLIPRILAKAEFLAGVSVES